MAPAVRFSRVADAPQIDFSVVAISPLLSSNSALVFKALPPTPASGSPLGNHAGALLLSSSSSDSLSSAAPPRIVVTSIAHTHSRPPPPPPPPGALRCLSATHARLAIPPLVHKTKPRATAAECARAFTAQLRQAQRDFDSEAERIRASVRDTREWMEEWRAERRARRGAALEGDRADAYVD
jgi:hypothetical protein